MPASGPDPQRRFGLVVGGVFALLALWSTYCAHPVLAAVFASLATPLVGLGLVAPRLLAPVERAWMALAHVLGRINTTLILALLYYLVFTPIGAVRRLFSDPLDRRMGEPRPSHWTARERAPADPSRYRQQF